MRWSGLTLLFSFLLIGACWQTTDTKQKQWDNKYRTSTGKTFVIWSETKGQSLMDIKLMGKGFQNMNDTILIKDTDPLTQVFLLDLNKDGFDEIYLITTSAGSGSYASIYGFSSNRDLSFSPIYVPEITESDLKDESLFAGYMGHDSIYSTENRLMRTFPVYKDGDANCCPTGGFRILFYKIHPGEASWVLKID